MSIKRPSLGSLFYYDGHTRSPARWLLPSPSASTTTLCLYSLHVPPPAVTAASAQDGPTAALVLNVVRARTARERALVESLRRRLFPGCLIDLPVRFWTRTTVPAAPAEEEEEEEGSVPFQSGRGGVLEDYLGSERGLKSIILGSLHIR